MTEAPEDATTDVLQRIVEENLGVYRASAGRLQEDVSQEAQVASDYRGRLVFEILQNADDAMSDTPSHDDRVSFLITDDALWVANSGRSLTEPDVKGLCGLGASSKLASAGPRRASIGHKGLGFKSVLEITDAPEVYSRTHSFVLGADEASAPVSALWEELGRPAPQYVPRMRFPREVSGLPGRWQELLERGYNTAFRLPFKASFDAERRAALADILLTLPVTTVLFLKNLEQVEVVSQIGGADRSQSWQVQRFKGIDAPVPVPALRESGSYRVDVAPSDGPSASFLLAHTADVEIGAHRGGLSGPAWDGVQLTEVSVAALRPDHGGTMPDEWRHFHVFLPTQEPNPYPILVNGAFATDLSRRHVTVMDEAADYNSHLVRSAAALIATVLLPAMAAHSPDAALTRLDRGDAPVSGPAARLLHAQLSEALVGLPVVPTESDGLAAIGAVALPSRTLGELGSSFRAMLSPDARWESLPFPDALHCVDPFARVLLDHGATALSGEQTLRALAHNDPERSRLTAEPDNRFSIDPVLDVATGLWRQSDHPGRQELQQVARRLPLFPTGTSGDGTVTRVAVGGRTAFYPPKSAPQAMPLQRLDFLAHAVCWGTVALNDRKAVFGDRMLEWSGLFDVSEFDFPNVVRAAVLPALVREPEGDAAALLAGLRSMDALAAVCQLAGRSAKPDRPLRYQRLEADRALSQLARLPVPVRVAEGDPVKWEPAYRVYFGTDWLGDESVEHLLDAVPDTDASRPQLAPLYLAPPSSFLGRLDMGEDIDEPAGADEDDEVPEDDDAGQALEGDERERWLSFLTWLGVNPCLRLVHFHDVNDLGTGWLTTKDLAQPKGWAFAQLTEEWEAFSKSVEREIKAIGAKNAVPYLYEARDLDLAEPLLGAAERDATAHVAERLLEHLAQHWSRLGPMSEATVALVPEGKQPTSRSSPPRAYPEERHPAGDDLWLMRLKDRGVCPTSMGPRTPKTTWQRSQELERRFGRASRNVDALLPVLRVQPTAGGGLRGLADRLGVRRELAASTFSLADARTVCDRIELLWPAPSPTDMPRIKGVYREMFELLSGWSDEPGTPLADVRLLAESPAGLEYVPASELLYARSPGSRERSGIGDKVRVFVLEAEPAVTAPVTALFGARLLETTLQWEAESEEVGFDQEALSELHANLALLEPVILARIKVERSARSDATRDGSIVRQFTTNLEPVRALTLACRLDGQLLARLVDRQYHVDVQPGARLGRVRIVWNEQPWPPTFEVATGMSLALADALGLSLVEAFDSLIRSPPEHRRRLLALAGAEGYLDELEAQPSASPVDQEAAAQTLPATPTPGAPLSTAGAVEPSDASGPAAAVIPLRDFASLTIDGVPLLVTGAAAVTSAGAASANGHVAAGPTGPSAHRAAPGTDLKALDRLGMSITMAYEMRRLARRDVEASTLEHDGAADSWVVPVDTTEHIALAIKRSTVVAAVFEELGSYGISPLYPGFDVLTIEEGQPARLIELKSSGVDARVQEMSWNEWKSASTGTLRQHFWLYLVGNLRADLRDAVPFVRAVRDPFGSLDGVQQDHEQRRRVMQLRVQEFKQAEYLALGVVAGESGEDS